MFEMAKKTREQMTDEQLEWLRARNCDEYQGYRFSRPIPLVDFQRMVSSPRVENDNLVILKDAVRAKS